jgi:V/A-type H+/Na+-transporting ATPase subunit I
MPVAKLRKILIITHISEKKDLFERLQKEAIAEIKPIKQKVETSEQELEKLNLNISNTKKSLEILNEYKNMLGKASKSSKIVIKRSEYKKILSGNDFEDTAKEIINTEQNINHLKSEIEETEKKIHTLKSWSPYKGNLDDLKKTERYTIKLARTKGKKIERELLVEELKAKNVSIENIDKANDTDYLLIAYLNSSKKDIEAFLSGKNNYEEADLLAYSGTISQNIEDLSGRLKKLGIEKKKFIKKMKDYIFAYEKHMTVYLDSLENELETAKAINLGYSTESVSLYGAWIDAKKMKKVQDIISSFQFSKSMEIEADEDEEVPTILENKRIFKPFEIIVNLYGLPRRYEIDPTPFLSLFFAAFFGLCLTDAGYGFILIALAIVFAFKMKPSRNFLMLILFGGIFTVFAGAIFNGWFGDLPRYFGLEKFFFRFAILGDPINSTSGAMNFFRLALILGVIQVIFGLFIKFFDALRRKDIKEAFFDALTWIIIVLSLVVILLSTQIAVNMQLVDTPMFPASISRYLVWALLPAALTVILFSARDEKSWGFRLFMGFLNLTVVNGLTSYLGDVLSYIRLMALGLVTAGIGVAINQIAFQMLAIPVIGIAITIIALIFGHTFNIGINILGAFVHTMRLQYVEFFQKFYVGGGKPFEALKTEHNYITLVDD